MIEHENDQLVSVASETDINTSNNTSDEPLLRENSSRFVLFPIKHNDVSIDISCVVLFCNII